MCVCVCVCVLDHGQANPFCWCCLCWTVDRQTHFIIFFLCVSFHFFVCVSVCVLDHGQANSFLCLCVPRWPGKLKKLCAMNADPRLKALKEVSRVYGIGPSLAHTLVDPHTNTYSYTYTNTNTNTYTLTLTLTLTLKLTLTPTLTLTPA